MSNNQANDRYNPPGTSNPDWDERYFSDVDVGEVIWMNTNPNQDENCAHRKLDESTVGNLVTRTSYTVEQNTKVYVKE